MTFTEIFDNLKNHSYIRRESWSKDVFIQYRHTAPLIRLIKFEELSNDLNTVIGLSREKANQHGRQIIILNNDIRITAEDLFANDWKDIDNV
jgi:hypothetical protein